MPAHRPRRGRARSPGRIRARVMAAAIQSCRGSLEKATRTSERASTRVDAPPTLYSISPHSEDRTLLARFAAGDEDSLAAVFERHRPVLRRQAGRLLRGSGHEPDDVLQDVYLRAHAALRAGVVPIEPRAWLLRLVRNACLDELRRARTRPVGDVELEALPVRRARSCPTSSPAAPRRARCSGDIHRLPDRQRSVLVMSAIDGLSHEEVAGRLDTTVEHDPLAAGARAREPPPDRRRARDRVRRPVARRAGRGRVGGRARERDRAPAPVELLGLPRLPARPAQRRPRACAGSRAGARGASSRSCSAAAARGRAEGRGRRVLRARRRRRRGRRAGAGRACRTRAAARRRTAGDRAPGGVAAEAARARAAGGVESPPVDAPRPAVNVPVAAHTTNVAAARTKTPRDRRAGRSDRPHRRCGRRPSCGGSGSRCAPSSAAASATPEERSAHRRRCSTKFRKQPAGSSNAVALRRCRNGPDGRRSARARAAGAAPTATPARRRPRRPRPAATPVPTPVATPDAGAETAAPAPVRHGDPDARRPPADRDAGRHARRRRSRRAGSPSVPSRLSRAAIARASSDASWRARAAP